MTLSAIDLTNPRVYYKTAYNNTIRCIDLKDIDFSRVEYGSYPLDKVREQPIEMIRVEVDTIISIAWPFYRVTLNTFPFRWPRLAVAEFTHRRPAFPYRYDSIRITCLSRISHLSLHIIKQLTLAITCHVQGGA